MTYLRGSDLHVKGDLIYDLQRLEEAKNIVCKFNAHYYVWHYCASNEYCSWINTCNVPNVTI